MSFENTYLYGDTHGEPMTETSPLSAQTRKGKVRRAMVEQLRTLHDAGDLRVGTALGVGLLRAARYHAVPIRGSRHRRRGSPAKPAQVIGDPDQPHSYRYTVDAARTLAVLGSRDDTDGEIFHVPNAPARTTREIIAMISAELGSPIKVSVAPRLVLRMMGLFNPTIRELDEMRYEFTQPFIIDITKAQTRLGIEATPLTHAVTQTVSWFRSQHDRSAS